MPVGKGHPDQKSNHLILKLCYLHYVLFGIDFIEAVSFHPIKGTLQSQSSPGLDLSLCHSFMKRGHPSSDQLPGWGGIEDKGCHKFISQSAQ